MVTFIDQQKLVQVCICLFGTLSIYLVYGIIYERIIMSPYESIVTQEKEFFESATGLVLIERGVSWLLAEVACRLFVNEQQKVKLPQKDKIICGFLTFVSALIFTHTIYSTSYRITFAIRTAIFLITTAVGLFYSCKLKPIFQGPRKIDLLLSVGITGGAILFWVFDTQICFYVPVEMKIVALTYLIFSCFSDGAVSIFQSKMSHQYKPHMLIMMRDISRWTAIFSLLLVLLFGELPYILNFCLSHFRFTLDAILLSVLYFIGQVITFRAISTMPQNFSAYLEASGKAFHVQMSFALTVHKHHFYQLVGFILSATSIILQAVLMSKSSNSQSTRPSKSFPYHNELAEVSSDDHQMEEH